MFIKKDFLNFKLRNGLDKFDNNIEVLSIKIANRNLKNIVGNIKAFKDLFRATSSKSLLNKEFSNR